jgi:hypothetical protein
VGQEALVGPTLVVGIGEPNPEKDLASFDGFLEKSRVSGYQPKS